MTFQLVYYSQQDPKWKDDILGFGEASDTIGYVGCALTSTAMLLSGHGFNETPTSLNQKLKDVGGFAGAGIRWGAVSRLYPQVTVKSNVSCINSDAPLAQIDASIAVGQPVIVMVDSAPAAGLLTHWVMLYAKEGDDYLMLDPWPYQTDIKKKTFLTPRYSQGNPLRRSIMHVIVYDCSNASGGIAVPGGKPEPVSAKPRSKPVRGRSYARVKADVTWGLNIRSSIDTSNAENIVAAVPAGSILTLLEADGRMKLGAVNQWVRVQDEQGHEGYAAAWYLDEFQPSAPPPKKSPAITPASERPTPTTPKPAAELPKLIVVVKSAGTKVLNIASAKSEVLSKERAGAKLVVEEPVEQALPKIGIAGKWLNVKCTNGKRGFIDGGSVKEG